MRARHSWTRSSAVRVPALKTAFMSAIVAESRSIVFAPKPGRNVAKSIRIRNAALFIEASTETKPGAPRRARHDSPTIPVLGRNFRSWPKGCRPAAPGYRRIAWTACFARRRPALSLALTIGRESGFAVGQLADLAAPRNSEGVMP